MTLIRLRHLHLWLFALAFLGYTLPWVNHSAAAFSLHAFDLAAWSARHIDEFTQAPTLLTSLLLRGQLLILAALWSGGQAKKRWPWLLSLLLWVALLPPLDALIQQFDNPNHQQLLFLSIAAMILSVWGGILRGGRLAYWTLAWTSLGIASSALAIARATQLFKAMGLTASLGVGGPLLCFAYATLALAAWLNWRKGI